MAKESEQQPPDLMRLWREWLKESERQFNTFLNETMESDSFARSAGGYIEAYASFQRLMAQGMERYLSFMNMPSRADVSSLAETLRTIEARLSRIEEMLQIAAEDVDIGRAPAPSRKEPRRTRGRSRPRAARQVKKTTIPEELRRSG